MAYSEFALIEKIRSKQKQQAAYLNLGIGDDAALIELDQQSSYVVCTDTSVLGAHFTDQTPIAAVAHKSLAVNLSDIAAMGAKPLFYLLNLTHPNLSSHWCEQLMTGLDKLSKQYDLVCIGGDTTKGPESITITAIGQVPTARALKRSGAQVGDLICVSGELGYGAYALHHPEHAQMQKYLLYPEPQIELGQALLGKATAAIDISDGLLADLNHILAESGVGAEVLIEQVPGLATLTQWLPEQEALRDVLTGGDDYQLCFTLPKQHLDALQQQFNISVIGEITQTKELKVFHPDGRLYQTDQLGFSHFRGDDESK